RWRRCWRQPDSTPPRAGCASATDSCDSESRFVHKQDKVIVQISQRLDSASKSATILQHIIDSRLEGGVKRMTARPENVHQARLLRLLREEGARSRAELGDVVQLSRSKLALELD